MCYVIAPAGLALLAASTRPGPMRSASGSRRSIRRSAGRPGRRSRAADLRRLRQARHDVHVDGLGARAAALRRRARCGCAGATRRFSPPRRATPAGRAALAPADLRLPGGRVPHDFLRTGRRRRADRGRALRDDPPGCDRRSELPRRPSIDVIVELDDRLPQRPARRSSSAMTTSSPAGRRTRVATASAGRPSRWSCSCAATGTARARCAQLADSCCARAGPTPASIRSTGSTRAGSSMLFAAERDMHEGLRRAYGVPRLPPRCASSRRMAIRAPASRSSRRASSLAERRLACGCSRVASASRAVARAVCSRLSSNDQTMQSPRLPSAAQLLEATTKTATQSQIAARTR